MFAHAYFSARFFAPEYFPPRTRQGANPHHAGVDKRRQRDVRDIATIARIVKR
jgi:hypothetical protein